MPKIMITIFIWVCSLLMALELLWWLFATAFNDTGNMVFQHEINVNFLWALAIAAVTVILISIRPWILQKSWVLIAIAVIGIISSVLLAIVPYILAPQKQAAADQQAELKMSSELQSQTQGYIKNKQLLSSTEVKDLFDNSRTLLAKYKSTSGLTAWQQLLDAKLINPNVLVDAPYNSKGVIVNKKQPILMYVLTNAFGTENNFAKALLQNGANVNAVDEEGNTPLLSLAHDNSAESFSTQINLLLSCGADSAIKDTEGKTAVDYLTELRSIREGDLVKQIDDEIAAIKAAEVNRVKPGACQTKN